MRKFLFFFLILILTGFQFGCNKTIERVTNLQYSEDRIEITKRAKGSLKDLGINERDEQKLLEAVQSNDQSLVTIFLDSGFSGEIVNPLVEASSLGNIRLVKYFIEEIKGNVNSWDGSGRTPLFAAIRADQEEIIQYLIEKNADMNLAASDGVTPLMIAVVKANTKLVSQLIKKGADLNRRTLLKGHTALMLAAFYGNSEIVRILLEEGADPHAPDNQGNNALHSAVAGANPAALRLLLARKMDVDAKDKDGYTPLARAAYNQQIPEVDILLGYGAKPYQQNNDGESVLYLSIIGADNKMHYMRKQFKLEKKEWSDKNYKEASLTGTLLVYKLLNHGASPHFADKNGLTPLMLVANTSQLFLMEALLNKITKSIFNLNEEINAKDSQGMTALHYAAYSGNDYNVQTLIEKGANLNLKNKVGQTALQIAFKRGNKEAQRVLTKALQHDKGPARQAQEQKP